MTDQPLTETLFSFINDSPTPFHAVANIVRILEKSGFTILDEGRKWQIERGGRYAVIRNGSLIAFTLENLEFSREGFRMLGGHTDSPSLQLKPHPRAMASPYFQFGVEKYGGALLSTWFDRELSLAGRITVQSESGTPCSLLIDFEKPVLYIPSLAIHLDRKANEGREINAQTDISPVLAQNISSEEDWHSLLAERLNNRYPDLAWRSILGYDLFCYDCSPPRFLVWITNSFAVRGLIIC